MQRCSHGPASFGTWIAVVLACLLLAFTGDVVQVVPGSATAAAATGFKRSRGKQWQVSNRGRCRNTRGRITFGNLYPSGYQAVNIAGRNFLVHRLVALAFLGPPPDDAAWQVNHMDGNPSNNQLENLAWVTQSQNILHSYNCLPRKKCAHPRSKPVMINGTRFSSVRAAAQQLGLCRSTLWNWCHKGATVDGCSYQICGDGEANDAPLPKESWKPMILPTTGMAVAGRMVSSLGRVKSKSGFISFGRLHAAGYLVTEFAVLSKRYQERIHRLVAYAFLGPPPTVEHKHVNHKDMNKTNNTLDNLEYVTPSGNRIHYYANCKGPNLNCKPVLSRAFGSHDEWKRHPSIAEAATTLALHGSLVSMCASARRKQTGGYEFRYAEEPQEPQNLPGEEWRDIDVEAHLREQEMRMKRKK